MALTPEELQEYQSELNQLADEWTLGNDTVSQVKAREGAIRKRIMTIADKFNPSQRVVMQVPELNLQWDRQIAKKAGTGDVSLDQLERILGPKKFQTLCTTRTVAYTFDMEKFLAARASGEITDSVIAASTVPQEYTFRLALSKIPKVAVVEEDIEDE
jgi:hypothetical protein